MAPGPRRIVGDRAELLANRYLCQRGLRTVARNFRTRRGELDLVMLDDNCLAFVEVRYRGPGHRHPPGLTVNHRKQQKLIAAASMFLARHAAFREHACRFDVVGVTRDRDGDLSIDWLRDAFRPGD